jgi:hypothetical protein
MKRLVRSFLVLFGLGVAAALMSHFTSPPATAIAPIPVQVTNTPLPVQGTVSANVVNPVTVSGTVNANINGTPTVNANVTNASLTVGNPATNPVLVRDVDNAANNPFESYVCRAGGVYTANCAPGLDTVTIPTTTDSGAPVKMLVIEYVSGSCKAGVGGDISNVQFDIPFGGYAHYLVPVRTYSDSNEIDYAFAQETRLYAGPGQPVTVGTERHVGSPDYECILQFTGHFVTQ